MIEEVVIPECEPPSGPVIWVFGPRLKNKALVILSKDEPMHGESLALPRAYLSAAQCRREAFLLTQVADMIEGRVVAATPSGYTRMTAGHR
jgi:hypothetical protein